MGNHQSQNFQETQQELIPNIVEIQNDQNESQFSFDQENVEQINDIKEYLKLIQEDWKPSFKTLPKKNCQQVWDEAKKLIESNMNNNET